MPRRFRAPAFNPRQKTAFAALKKKIQADPMNFNKIKKMKTSDLYAVNGKLAVTGFTADKKKNHANSNPKAWAELVTKSCEAFFGWPDSL